MNISNHDTNISLRLVKTIDCVYKLHVQLKLHVRLSLIHDLRSIENETLELAGKCYAYGVYISKRVANWIKQLN